MKRQTVMVLAGLVGLISATASAQDRAQTRRGWRGVGDVSQAVALTQEQKQKVGELEEKLSTKLREQMGELRRDESTRETWRQVRQQILESAEAGDDAKVEALQKKQNETGWTALRRKLAIEHYDAVAKLLTSDQKKPFAVWRKLQDSGVPANLLAQPEALKAALTAAKLSDAQKKKIDAAFAQYEAQVKAIKPGAESAKRDASQALATTVVGQLKPS